MNKNKSVIYIFNYEGINQYGQNLHGEIQAASHKLAKLKLRKQGVITHKLVKKRTFLTLRTNHFKEITGLMRQLVLILEAGIPLAQALDILAKSQINIRMKNVMANLYADINSGLTLAEAMEKHPLYFNDLFCNLIRVGEQSSNLNPILNDLVLHREKIENLKKNLKKILFYPAVLTGLAFLVISALIFFIMPQFESLFKEFHAELPFYTQLIIKGSQFLEHYSYLIGICFAILYYAFHYWEKYSETFAKKKATFLLKIPYLGTIFKKIALASFIRSLLLSLKSGIPLVKALESAGQATGNMLFSEAIATIKNQITAGYTLHEAMSFSPLFPISTIQMISIAEKSSTLKPILMKITELCEEEIDASIALLYTSLEPILISLLGLIIGGLVIAIYLPLFKLGQIV